MRRIGDGQCSYVRRQGPCRRWRARRVRCERQHLAQSAPSGENPSGHINATLPSPGTPGDTFHVPLEVVCLAVVGNLAAVGAVVTESSSNDLPPGTPFVVLYRDTGLPGGAGDSIEPLFGAPAMDCAAFVGLAAASPPVRNGNISIYDASP